ncbi:sugar transferase [Fusobacterium nucleatum]|jgi:capsular polysaccharide biosynthesis protein cps4E|uniref:sugar transferase n=1 Tax=Fusobacterium nucleatum TaxID=851 RepID=UPI001C6FFF1E|nr:sugar transferase [Fusobacterium nucleatum]MBW9311349.1 sugar transferase [Fusobacterium nucleatum]
MLYRKFGKRVVDTILSFIGVILLSPLFLIIALLIKLDSKGSVIFRHKRLGKNCEPIYVLKFRTMVENAVLLGPQYTKDNDSRITKIGKFLRKTSLDELPQFINVFKGDMSIIGPRPDAYTDSPTDIQRMRTKILPGITGLAQVNGRSNLDEKSRGDYDLEYIEKYSFIYDLKIFIKTILIVVLRKGTN